MRTQSEAERFWELTMIAGIVLSGMLLTGIYFVLATVVVLSGGGPAGTVLLGVLLPLAGPLLAGLLTVALLPERYRGRPQPLLGALALSVLAGLVAECLFVLIWIS